MNNRGEVVAQTPLGLNGWKCWERIGWGDWGEGRDVGGESVVFVGKNIDCVGKNI